MTQKVISDAALLAALRAATTRQLSPNELHEQRVSFVMSTLKDDSDITRARVEKELAKQSGQDRE